LPKCTSPLGQVGYVAFGRLLETVHSWKLHCNSSCRKQPGLPRENNVTLSEDSRNNFLPSGRTLSFQKGLSHVLLCSVLEAL
jgi:hypothetical protein